MSGSRYVSENEIKRLKRECGMEISDLKQSVRSYCSKASEIETVISNLIAYYNTEGGQREVKKLGNVDLLGDSFKGLLSWANSIKITYAYKYEITKK